MYQKNHIKIYQTISSLKKYISNKKGIISSEKMIFNSSRYIIHLYNGDSVDSQVGNVAVCTAFKWCEFDSWPPTAVWYTLWQGAFAVANFPEKLSAYILPWQFKPVHKIKYVHRHIKIYTWYIVWVPASTIRNVSSYIIRKFNIPYHKILQKISRQSIHGVLHSGANAI